MDEWVSMHDVVGWTGLTPITRRSWRNCWSWSSSGMGVMLCMVEAGAEGGDARGRKAVGELWTRQDYRGSFMSLDMTRPVFPFVGTVRR